VPDSAGSPLIATALVELKLSADALGDHDGIQERIASRFERVEAGLSRRMTRAAHEEGPRTCS
jgi:biopolymer transport protein ExbB